MQERSSVPVLVVDDHPIFREGVSALLTTVTSRVLVADSGDEAHRCLLALNEPPVVLWDLGLPDQGRGPLPAWLRDPSLVRSVLVLSAADHPERVRSLLREGAAAFISKSVPAAQLVEAVWAAVRGVLPADTVLGTAVAPEAAWHFLGARERIVLQLIATGRSNAAVAVEMGLAESTVKKLVSSVFDALGVMTRSQAIIRARQLGLVDA